MIVEPESADLPGTGDNPEPSSAPQGPLTRAAYLIGSIGLVAASATDATAVAGRHLGFRLLGSVELVQVAVVLVAASAMVVATVVGGHAAVHIITERVSPSARALLARFGAALGAVAFALLAAGSAWVAADLWGGYEQTELLRIGLRWFRAIWIAAATLIVFLFLRSAFGGRR